MVRQLNCTLATRSQRDRTVSTMARIAEAVSVREMVKHGGLAPDTFVLQALQVLCSLQSYLRRYPSLAWLPSWPVERNYSYGVVIAGYS